MLQSQVLHCFEYCCNPENCYIGHYTCAENGLAFSISLSAVFVQTKDKIDPYFYILTGGLTSR